MERLTSESNITDIFNGSFALRLFLKLKEYEDTGLSPNEVKRLKRENGIKTKIIQSVRTEVIISGSDTESFKGTGQDI